MRLKRWFRSLLIIIVMLSSAIVFYPNKADAAISPSRMFQDPNNPNIYYFVGMVYFEVWKASDGNWTRGLAPGMSVPVDGFNYEFEFNSSRKIKDITMSQFTYSGPHWEDIFNASRTGELEGNDLQYYQVATSSRSYGYSSQSFSGGGMNIGKMSVYVTNGYLGAVRPIDRKAEEEAKGQTFAPGVEGYRYYFPTLFTIELEPIQGEAIIRHYTTTGQPLNGIDGFRDRTEVLTIGQRYKFEHTPDTQNYRYVGHKKSSLDPPSGGSISSGDPNEFEYNGSHPKYYAYFYYEPIGDDPPGGGDDPPPPNEVNCTVPSPAGTMRGENFSPNPAAVIRADQRGNEKFNVAQGIPTTEKLFGNVWSKTYLYQYEYQEMVGTCTFQVNVSIDPPPPDPNAPPEPPPVPGQPAPAPPAPTNVRVTVDREYSYWTVRDVQVFQIKEAALWNYAFDGGGIRLQPTGYYAPYYATARTGNYSPNEVTGEIRIPFGADPEDAARSAASVTVRNDTFTFYGNTLMNGSSTTNRGSRPSPIPESSMIGDNVLYSSNHMIPMSKTNKGSQPSSGTVYYEQVSGSETRNFAIHGINAVTVHTPVVIYPSVSDDKAHNQKTTPAVGRSALILERTFTVKLPNSGQHTNYTGYGNRNYVDYIGSKQVRFPFDVYDGTKEKFFPKNTWINFVNIGQEEFTFYLPVWVDEGFYDVEFRTIAHNAPGDATHQTNANTNLAHHIAYDTVPVDVIGRLYDFHITDIADYDWEEVFRVQQGSAIHTGNTYWVGLNTIDGNSRGNDTTYTLPIRPGSHPTYNNTVVKKGYHFKFDLKTKGNLFGPQDQIVITPTFYYISKQGGERFPVDLYYHTAHNNYVRIGSPLDQVQRYVILGDRFRSVPIEQLIDTALYKYDHEYTFGQVAEIDRVSFVQRYIDYIARQPTMAGSFSKLYLTAPIRTIIGPKTNLPAEVDPARAIVSIQQWYGEYSLPADLFAVRTGTNVAEYGRTHNGLSGRSPIFLQDGYIVVNFNIETIREGKVDQPYLQYIYAPLMNQWLEMEGYSRSAVGLNGEVYPLMDGDVVFYDTDRSSRDDFRPMVTH